MLVLVVSSCALQGISRLDLNGLDRLEHIDLSFNNLKILPDDLFVGKLKLQEIKLNDNKIIRASSMVLEPLLNNGLKVVDFRRNPVIDEYFEEGSNGSINTLLRSINCKCESLMVDKDHFKDFGKLYETGQFSDFVIQLEDRETLKTHNFYVHKYVLITKSPVFEAMFSHPMRENLSGKSCIYGYRADVYDDFLYFLYNGVVKTADNASELKFLADFYDLPALRGICENIINDNIA